MDHGRTRRRPGRLTRLNRLFWTLLLFATGATQEGFGLRPCAHHELFAPESSAPHAGMEHMGSGHHHGAPDSPSHAPDHSGCTCVGTCATSGTAPLPALAPSVQAVVAEVRAAPLPATGEVQLPGRAPYLLPPSQAPPLLG
jgi:hypothetical protein